MEETKDYIEAWADEDEKQRESSPVTEAVVAAQKADKDAFADAFENDRFGIDIDKAKKKADGGEADGSEVEEVKAE